MAMWRQSDASRKRDLRPEAAEEGRGGATPTSQINTRPPNTKKGSRAASLAS